MSDITTEKASISLPPSFRFGEVDPAFTLKAGPPATPLGPLAHFVGRWLGDGFNTIFRPDNSVTSTAAKLPFPLPPGDNILELNLTTETLTFSPSLGDVPNRGSDHPGQPPSPAVPPINNQGDIFLNGVPYLQAITDVTDPDPKNRPGIHVEPGLWMLVPSTNAPAEGITITRMGSIPHGTTIQAQGTSQEFKGPPNIPVVKITPFVLGGSQAGNPVQFPSQTAADAKTPRLPQDLTSYIASGKITQGLLDDPNSFLRDHIKPQNITDTVEIKISTSPGTPIFGGAPVNTPLIGGGTDNIAFLLGDQTQSPPKRPNAHAIEMEATFWIETVQHTIEIPPFHPGQAPLTVQPQTRFVGQKVPSFVVNPPVKIQTPTKFTFTSFQIQYSQVVLLNFNGLSWPHVSVATLVPADPITVPPVAWTQPVA